MRTGRGSSSACPAKGRHGVHVHVLDSHSCFSSLLNSYLFPTMFCDIHADRVGTFELVGTRLVFHRRDAVSEEKTLRSFLGDRSISPAAGVGSSYGYSMSQEEASLANQLRDRMSGSGQANSHFFFWDLQTLERRLFAGLFEILRVSRCHPVGR